MNRHAMRALGADRRGATIIEFAIILPVMMTLIMGLAELSYQGYLQSILTGALQKAGRDSTIQGATLLASTIDTRVISQVQAAAPKATYTSSRKSYEQFGYVDPEPFTDANANGVRDGGECFSDINGNGIWDADPGVSGQGGASDAVVYTMVVRYPRLFPVARWFGWSSAAQITATTILKNQPYTSQATSTVKTVCT